ncbi:helix-turn-helix domain-containing protein [Kocuria sp. M1R5S2]|uniref:helix-turn-helix domain-containing protein n=1 Tax=Kocuria rhizosphaerae TaxID=3376285 RepID=UPI0037BB62D7
MSTPQNRNYIRTNRRGWPQKMRMKLVARDALVDRMQRKGWSNRRLAKYAEVSPGTIDNLIVGRTKAVNTGRTAELICEALDVPLDVFFVPEISCDASQTVTQRVSA